MTRRRPAARRLKLERNILLDEYRFAKGVARKPVKVTLLVPYGREDLTARLYRDAEVLSTEVDGDGTIVTARVGLRELAAVREFLRSKGSG